jgi:hypothetical protein
MAAKYAPNKVYLRNTRNGRIYDYEKNLASFDYMERVSADDKGKITIARAVAEPTPVAGNAKLDARVAALNEREADLEAREADLAAREKALRVDVRGTNGSVEQQDLDTEKDPSTANKLAEGKTPVDEKPTKAPLKAPPAPPKK